MLARTDPDAPKHRGISCFLLDMKTPGISVRPLINMARAHGFNEVVLRQRARAARRTCVGEENRGWYVGDDDCSTSSAPASGVSPVAGAIWTS